ncbi:MAG: peptide deformylase, partial [Actinomycetota bacterium]|nr:peptide deformylase [Actinomycetota bacterium]
MLKSVAEVVGKVDDEARALAADLVETMRAGPATVGLAAPQVGVSHRAFVLDVSSHPKGTGSHGLV